MAWIVGILNKDEEDILRKRGWEIEELQPGTSKSVAAMAVFGDDNEPLKMAWIDNDMFSIMSGPDWDTDEDKIV